MADQAVLASTYLTVTARDRLDVLVVSIVGKAGASTARALLRALDAALDEPGAVLVLDLAGLQSCSPAAMRVLADVVWTTRRGGVPVALVGLDRAYGHMWPLEDVPMPIQFATVEQAVESLTLGRAATDAPKAGARGFVNGLNRLKTTKRVRALADQATAVLMERFAGTSDKAFDLLFAHVQRSQRHLRHLEADLPNVPRRPLADVVQLRAVDPTGATIGGLTGLPSPKPGA